MTLIIFIHIFSCLIITGLIWTIQLVHYPSFKYIEPSQFQSFQSFHMKRITYIVGPLMLVELITAGLLLALKMNFFWTANFASVLTVWFYTAIVSVPIHNSLVKQMDIKKISKLVNTNWGRTLLWTLRASILCYTVIISLENVNEF